MNNEILEQLLKDAFTKPQLLRKIREVEQYLNDRLFSSPVIPPLSGEIQDSGSRIESGMTASLDKITAQEFPGLIENLKKAVDNLPTAIITTAVPMPDEVIQKTVLDLRRSTLPNLILDIKVNPEILAGATVIYKGVVHDYSLQKKINEQKGVILNSFKGFFK